jgi:hypothetical protein
MPVVSKFQVERRSWQWAQRVPDPPCAAAVCGAQRVRAGADACPGPGPRSAPTQPPAGRALSAQWARRLGRGGPVWAGRARSLSGIPRTGTTARRRGRGGGPLTRSVHTSLSDSDSQRLGQGHSALHTGNQPAADQAGFLPARLGFPSLRSGPCSLRLGVSEGH